MDIRNRGSLSFVYQPQFMKSNILMKNIVDGFQFAGAEIASGGEPIFLGVQGNIYAATALHRATVIRAASSAAPSVPAPASQPTGIPRRSAVTASTCRGSTTSTCGCRATFPFTRTSAYADQCRGLQPAEPPNHHRRERHLHHFPGPEREFRKLQVQRNYSSDRILPTRMFCALYRHWPPGLRSDVEHQQQHTVRLAAVATFSSALLLTTGDTAREGRRLRLPPFSFQADRARAGQASLSCRTNILIYPEEVFRIVLLLDGRQSGRSYRDKWLELRSWPSSIMKFTYAPPAE